MCVYEMIAGGKSDRRERVNYNSGDFRFLKAPEIALSLTVEREHYTIYLGVSYIFLFFHLILLRE